MAGESSKRTAVGAQSCAEIDCTDDRFNSLQRHYWAEIVKKRGEIAELERKIKLIDEMEKDAKKITRQQPGGEA